MNGLKINGETCCEDCMKDNSGLYVQMCSIEKKITSEKMSGDILAFYK
jgi:hypothetical protein